MSPRKPSVPQTDAAKDIAAMAAKAPSRRGAHLNGLTQHTRPASGIPAMGKGYGGPAKGSGADLSDPKTHAPPTKKRIADKAATRERMLVIMEEIAENAATHPMVRLAAADKVLDRLQGKPVNMNLNMDPDDLDRLSDDDAKAEAVRLYNQAVEAGAAPEPGRLPH